MKVAAYLRYYQEIEIRLKAAFAQENKIKKAATWIADCLISDGWIYTSGTGHSHLLAEEIFYRAGGFARIRPIFHEPLMLHQNASESSSIERQENLASKLLKDVAIQKNDVFLIASNSGRNTVSIEMALEAKDRGAKVISITNLKHSQSVISRHSSGQKLFEISDLYLDNFGEIGDACIALEGQNLNMGPTSTVIGAALLQSIMVQAAEYLLQNKKQPEIFSSSNSDQGEKHNLDLLRKYHPLVKGL
ncbi:MAG: sugar isomerase domain-containing protein [Bacteroidota bacterium]